MTVAYLNSSEEDLTPQEEMYAKLADEVEAVMIQFLGDEFGPKQQRWIRAAFDIA
jgi:hypothetical protein